MNNVQKDSGYIFPQETINSLDELGTIFEKIYRRMKSEGYDIIDNRIIHLETGKEYDPKRSEK